jgi:AcrR family transcriptional regulator
MSQVEEASLGRQALKSRKTREKILQSAISLIREGGYSSASAARIAERAGITWGAAQHHFGSKDEILDAVMEVSHRKFIELMSSASLRRGTLADRVDIFVDLMWQHYQDDVYLAALEILLASRSTDAPPVQTALFESRAAHEHLVTVREIFFDSDLSDEQIQEALIFIHCVLTGLTIEKVLEGEIHYIERHIRRSKLMLLTILSNI